MKKEIIQFIINICELKPKKVDSIKVIIKTSDGEIYEKEVRV